MVQEREEGSLKRIKFLKIAFVFLFILYAGRLFSLQVLSGEFHRLRAQNIARQTMPIPAQRGEIFDRHFDQPIVTNIDSFAVSVIPAEVPRGFMPELISRLSEVLGVNREQIERRLPRSVFFLYQPIEVASNIPFSTIAVLAEQVDSLPGVSWQSKPMRNYIETGSLAHIVGYVGSITREEFTMLYNLGYQQGDIIGKNGIERQYDMLLRGTEGRETRTVDVRGRNVTGINTRLSPESGKNLVLTIDRRIQTLAERALGRRIGAVVVLRPSTGEILAMVSSPWYDPNIFNQADLSSEYQALVNDPDRPFINRAIQASYPPASSFKIVMSTGLLAENAIPTFQTVECRGEIHFGDRLWRCHVRPPGHGRLNIQRALAQSCNVFYWTTGRDLLGVDNIVKYSMEYGFGQLSEIDLPGEVRGLVPTPQWKERRLHERWMAGDTMNISIGQGDMQVTPLQMANMVAMVVNDGVIYRPHLIKEIRDPRTGAVEMSVGREILHSTETDPGVFAALRQDMRRVVTEGTVQYPMNLRTVEVAGKTGTGEAAGIHDSWHSWLVSYGPFETEDPDERIVVSVIVEASNPWEWWAPYASAIIYQGIFADQTYEQAIRTLGFSETNIIRGRRE